MTANTVYVVQQRFSRQNDGSQRFHNYDSAHKFGTVTYLVPPKKMVDEHYSGDIDRLLQERLSKFSKGDYLILSGDPVLCAQAVLWAVSMLDDDDHALKILKWNHEQEDYFPVDITLPF